MVVERDDEKLFDRQVDAWIDENWGRIVDDLDSLVRIESVEDLDHAREGAPFGPGPRVSLSRALEIAGDMGLRTCDVDGYMGYADLPGDGEGQLGIIGHTDVVPAGPGWHFPPFEVSRREGYLVGRGVIDDKGPLMCALHAVRFWAERGEKLPATVRVLFGADEECGMKDVPYYRERHADPDFLFTPDAEFPVCYGEKGAFGGKVVSAPIEGGRIVSIEGGVAHNAVPGLAHAVVEFPGGEDALDLLVANDNVQVRLLSADEVTALCAVRQDAAPAVPLLRVDATGKSAHASTPELGVNAIGILASYLLRNNLLSAGEAEFMRLAMLLIDDWHGTGWNLACEDEDFGPLTIAGTVIALEGGRLSLVYDCRFPTSTSLERLRDLADVVAASHHATSVPDHETEPFLVERDTPEVQELIAVYNQVTGENAQPFTMGGGTYARKFSRAVSFGAEKPWEEMPAWAGGMHGPDEAVREDLLRQATKIYIYAIRRLCEVIAAK